MVVGFNDTAFPDQLTPQTLPSYVQAHNVGCDTFVIQKHKHRADREIADASATHDEITHICQSHRAIAS